MVRGQQTQDTFLTFGDEDGDDDHDVGRAVTDIVLSPYNPLSTPSAIILNLKRQRLPKHLLHGQGAVVGFPGLGFWEGSTFRA